MVVDEDRASEVEEEVEDVGTFSARMAGRSIGNEVGAAEEITWEASTCGGRKRSANGWDDRCVDDGSAEEEAEEEEDAAVIGSTTGETVSEGFGDGEEVAVGAVLAIASARVTTPSLLAFLLALVDGSAGGIALADKGGEAGGSGGGNSLKLAAWRYCYFRSCCVSDYYTLKAYAP